MSFFGKPSLHTVNSRWLAAIGFTVLAAMLIPATSFAQGGAGGGGGGGNQGGGGGGGTNFFAFTRVIGGVDVDPNGVLNTRPANVNPDVVRQLSKSLAGTSADLNQAGLRMISLRGLEAAIADSVRNGTPLPPEVQYMAGLQRIEYVIESPETNDIILAGPGEAFEADEQGRIVGVKSRMPVIQLQDFLVAMRHINNARSGYGITVSIDPTEEGVRRYTRVISQMRTINTEMARELEQAMGPNNITLTGIPKDSRYAHILVSADYRMKRLSMGLEQTPEYLPSLLAMAQQKDAQFRMAPRFWMECSYDAIGVSDDGRVHQLKGQGVKCLTEESHFDKDGNRTRAGKANKLAQKWADSMTANYERLSQDEPVFRELRNLMDLSVVAALIERDQLTEKVGLDIPAIKGETMVSTPRYPAPQQVPAQCSFVRLSRSWLVTASGGVDVNVFAVLDQTQRDPKLGELAVAVTKRTADRWWWNAE